MYFCNIKFNNNSNNKSSNTDTGLLYSRGFSYLPAPFWLEAEPADRLASENGDSFTGQVVMKGLGQHLQPSTE